MEYREIDPGPALAPFVRTLWVLRGAAPEPSFELVLPDGYAEIVVHRTGRFREWDAADRASAQASAIVAGVMERAVALAAAPSFETVGVRLLPYGLACLCEVPLDAATRIVSADAVLRPAAARLFGSVAQADTLRDAVGMLCRALSALLDGAECPPRAVVAAIGRLQRSGGLLAMDRLARETNVNPRTLERQFDHWVGLSPKRYARIVRFNRAVTALISTPDRPGAAVAAECGYYDQAHLSRDFRAFTGWAPRAFVTGRLGELTRHFAIGSMSDSSKTPVADRRDSGARGGLP